MTKPKLSITLLALAIGFYSCSEDAITDVLTEDSEAIVEEEMEEEEMEPEMPDEAAVVLENDRTAAITVLTKNEEKIWRIATAELANTNGTFNISDNFNVKDDEFVFKNSTLPSGKNATAFEGTLEWRKNNAIELNADSETAALNEFYLPAEIYSFDFEEGSSTKIISNVGSFEFTITADGTISATLDLEGVQLIITLTEKLEADYQAIPTWTLQFNPAFSFESNAISGSGADMVSSLANSSIYISMREDALADPGAITRPERIIQYHLNTGGSTETLFHQSDFVSKQLVINNNKLLVVGGQKINSYNLNLAVDPTSSQSYAGALGLDSFSVSRHGAAVYNNFVYLVGGALSSNDLGNRIYKYHIGTGVMTEFAVMPENRSGARAEIVNDKLYIFGGTTAFFAPPAKNTIYIYDLNTGDLAVEFMPTAVDFTYTSRSGHLIYVAGNVITRDNTEAITDEEPYIAVYDTKNGTFTELQINLPSPGTETIQGMSVFGSNIYIIYGKKETVPEGQLQLWEVLMADI